MTGDNSFIVGDQASISKSVTDADVRAYAELLGDNNPVHLDDDYARETRFGGRIAHGLIASGLIATLLGTKLPGAGTIYLSQTLKFVGPVRIPDTVTATVEIVSMHPTKPIYTLRTTCKNQNDEVVLDGEAVVLYEPVPGPSSR